MYTGCSASHPHGLSKVCWYISSDGEMSRPLLVSASSSKLAPLLGFRSQHLCGTLSFTTWSSY